MVKKIDLQELLIFINSSYVDDRLYIIAPHLYEEDIRYEVMWTGELNEPKWFVRQKGSDKFEHVDTDSLISVLNKKKVDLVEVHIELIQKVLANIAHLNLIIERADDLFGEDIVDQACSNLKEHYTKLQATIEKILVSGKKEKTKKKTKLSLIQNEEKEDEQSED